MTTPIGRSDSYDEIPAWTSTSPQFEFDTRDGVRGGAHSEGLGSPIRCVDFLSTIIISIVVFVELR